MDHVMDHVVDNVVIKSRNRCEAHIRIDGHDLLIWAITGGTLAVAFPDYAFSERFNNVDRLNEHIHPSRTAQEGPMPDDFDGGIETLRDFLHRNLSLRSLREEREQLLTQRFGRRLKSPRFHDTDNACYFRCELELRRGLSPVTVTGRWYAGRCDSTTDKFADSRWRRLKAYFNPFFDAGLRGAGPGGWETLTETEFSYVMELLAKE